jgi:hypothetical protein
MSSTWTCKERGRKGYGSPYRRPTPLPSKDKRHLTNVAYYRKKLNPKQAEAARVKEQIARKKRIDVLKEYQKQWDNPMTRPAMEARSASGRMTIAAHQAIIQQAVERWLQRQPETLTKTRWLDAMHRGYDQIMLNAKMISPGSRVRLRAKDEANLFRTLVRKGYLSLDIKTGLWENRCKAL